MVSLRRRLLLGTAGGSAAVMLAAGTALYVMVRTSLLAEFDHSLAGKAATLVHMIEQEGDRVELDFTEADMPEFTRHDRPEYFQAWREDAGVVERSASLMGRDLPRFDAPNGDPVIAAATLPDGRPGRVVTLHFAPRLEGATGSSPPPQRLALSLARDVLDVEAALSKVRFALFLVGAAAPLAAVGVLAWQVRTGLKPADRLAREIGAIDPLQLSARIDPAESPAELQPVVVRLNELLERLDAAVARERAMTADVAHELRTPLAGLRSILEVTMSRERDAADYREAASDCLAICRQTQAIVENVLALARLDVGDVSLSRAVTGVEALLKEAWAPQQSPAAQKKLHVAWDVEPGLKTVTDADKLKLALRNVLENAVDYCNVGGSVSIHARKDGDRARIVVVNTGSRVPAAEVHRVFDRFWRGDRSRRMEGAHCGLGLALSRLIVERLGGKIEARSSEGGLFRVALSV